MSDCPFGEGIFVWGVIKNIMYWGVYVYYNSTDQPISVNKHEQISKLFLYTLHSFICFAPLSKRIYDF